MNLSKCGAAIAMAIGICGQAHAAALVFDDTNPNDTVTVSANDFEFGLLVNGGQFQIGLNNPASGVFSEATPITFQGHWIAPTAGASSGQRTIYLVEAGSPDVISDIFFYDWFLDGQLGTIDGYFQSDVNNNLGLLPAGVNPADVFVENGQPVSFGLPFLSGRIMSDAGDVPEPASLALVGLALAGAAVASRRRN